MTILYDILVKNGLIGAFLFVAVVMFVSDRFAKLIKQERMSSAIAIVLGLVAAYIGGIYTGGKNGLSDVAIFSGIGLLGGSMLRDYTIISTAFGVKMENLKKAGIIGVISLFIGVFFAFIVGAVIAYIFGYRDAAEVTTIGAGAVTFIVGPVTATALGVSSDVAALSIAAGVVKSVACMIVTPLIAKKIKLDNPTAAMIYGGIMGTTSGTAGGLAATDPKLVPYGAMVATFYTGLGSLLCPSVCYFLVKLIL